MSHVVYVALFLAVILVVGNWFLEACESAARRHRTLRGES